eukprot:scaffold247265_cov28-Tisochrysis_lutea.AAC.2
MAIERVPTCRLMVIERFSLMWVMVIERFSPGGNHCQRQRHCRARGGGLRPLGVRRPLWGVVAAGGWEWGAVGARSIAQTITIVFAAPTTQA